MEPTSGTVKIFGKDILKEKKEVRKLIGICPQDLVFYHNLTVYENLVFFGKMYNKPLSELKPYAEFLIKHVGLEDKKNYCLIYKLRIQVYVLSSVHIYIF